MSGQVTNVDDEGNELAQEPWSSHRQSSFCTHANVMLSGGHTFVCADTVTIPTSSLSRVAVVVRQDKV